MYAFNPGQQAHASSTHLSIQRTRAIVSIIEALFPHEGHTYPINTRTTVLELGISSDSKYVTKCCSLVVEEKEVDYFSQGLAG